MNYAGQETGSDGPPKTFLSCGIRTNQLSFPLTGRPLCVVHLVCLVCLVYLVYLVCLVEQDKLDEQDKPDQPDEIDQMNQTSASSRVYVC